MSEMSAKNTSHGLGRERYENIGEWSGTDDNGGSEESFMSSVPYQSAVVET